MRPYVEDEDRPAESRPPKNGTLVVPCVDRQAVLYFVALNEGSEGKHLLRHQVLALGLPYMYVAHDEDRCGRECEYEQRISFR